MRTFHLQSTRRDSVFISNSFSRGRHTHNLFWSASGWIYFLHFIVIIGMDFNILISSNMWHPAAVLTAAVSTGRVMDGGDIVCVRESSSSVAPATQRSITSTTDVRCLITARTTVLIVAMRPTYKRRTCCQQNPNHQLVSHVISASSNHSGITSTLSLYNCEIDPTRFPSCLDSVKCKHIKEETKANKKLKLTGRFKLILNVGASTNPLH